MLNMTPIIRRLLTSTALFWLLAASAPAQQLQNCSPGGSNPNATLPIGYPNKAGNLWKAQLHSWLATLSTTDFSYQGVATDIVPPYVAFGAYASTSSFTSMATCESDWANASITLNDDRKSQIEQHFMIKHGQRNNVWKEQALRVDPAFFTLDEIEDEVTCTVQTPRLDWDANIAQLALWDYDGNPFFHNATVSTAFKKRLGSWLAVQLIMFDQAAWDRANQAPVDAVPAPTSPHQYHHPTPPTFGGVSDNLDMGIVLAAMATAYEAIKDEPWFVSSSALSGAFTDGLLTHAERVDLTGYWALHTNRSVPMISGQQLVYNATGSSHAAGWYLNALSSVFNQFFPAGYLAQDFRHDPTYSHMDPHSVVRILANHDTNLNGGGPLLTLYTAALRMHDLRAHLSFADATGLFLGPSAMATRTGGGPNKNAYNPSGGTFDIESQLYAAELAIPFADGILRDQSDFGLYGLRGAAPFSRLIDPLDPNRDFHAALGCRWPTGILGATTWSTADQQRTWPDSPSPRNYFTPWTLVFNHRVPSTGSLFQKRATRVQAQPETNLMPFELPGPYLRNFSDEYIFAKYGGSGVYGERGYNYCLGYNEYQGADSDLAALVHVGPVVANSGPLPLGYGGGQLAGLWSPSTGVAMLNRRTGRNNPPIVDDWAQWRRLPLHAATFVTDDDLWTSSARIAQPLPDVALSDIAPSFHDAWGWLHSANGPALSPVPEADAESTYIAVHGTLPTQGHDVAPSNPTGVQAPALDPNAAIGYERRFVVAPRLIFVRTQIDPNASGVANTDQFKEAWETLPLFVGRTHFGNGPASCPATEQYPVPIIEFVTGTGAVLNMTNSLATVDHVHVVRMRRNDGVMSIVFPEPRSIRLSEIYGDQSTDVSRRFLLRNLMVDLRPSGAGATFALQPVDLAYYIHFTGTEGTPPDPSGGSEG